MHSLVRNRVDSQCDTPERVRRILVTIACPATVVGANPIRIQLGAAMFYQLLDAATAVQSAGVGGSGNTVSVLAQEPPPPAPAGGGIDTRGFGTFLQTQILPPLLALGAIVLLTKAMKSAWSGVVTVLALSLLGLMWFGFSAKPELAISTGASLMRLIVPGV
jgi:hypothetical protein